MLSAAQSSGFVAFLGRLRPDSPFGKDAKASFGFTTDADALVRAWDDTDAVAPLLRDGDGARPARIRWHLARIPRFADEPRSLDVIDCFQLKKFLRHAGALPGLLTPALCLRFGLEVDAGGLGALLNRGAQDAETFFLVDDYSPELAEVRAALRALDAEASELDAQRRRDVRQRWGIDFTDRDLVVVERTALGDLDEVSRDLDLEPYDAVRVVARLAPGARRLAVADRRSALADAERAAEARVLAEISAVASAELPRLRSLRDAVARLDLALARARLSAEAGLTRPALGQTMTVRRGRLPGCEAVCRDVGAAYVPLDLELDGRPVALFGSNMGGKSVVLTTLAFLQLCVQHGLFVPAEQFETLLFDEVRFVGEGAVGPEARGLSGFGFEVRRLVDALELPGRVLLLFDEFARTTGSDESEALITAVLERLAETGRGQAVCATHAGGVRRLPGVRYLRMGGLRAPISTASTDEPLDERIARINAAMDYRIVEADAAGRGSDALDVALALGLDARLVAGAERFLHARRTDEGS